MPMHVPPGARVFEKAAFRCPGELMPQPLGIGPKAIDDTAPIDAYGRIPVYTIAKPA